MNASDFKIGRLYKICGFGITAIGEGDVLRPDSVIMFLGLSDEEGITEFHTAFKILTEEGRAITINFHPDYKEKMETWLNEV